MTMRLFREREGERESENEVERKKLRKRKREKNKRVKVTEGRPGVSAVTPCSLYRAASRLVMRRVVIEVHIESVQRLAFRTGQKGSF